jgi:hypothetical protein
MARDGDERPPIVGFFMIAVPSLIALIILFVVIAVYYPGHGKRVAGLYTSLAAPANKAVTADVTAYTKNQRTSLTKARTDLAKLVKADASFDDNMAEVGWPSPTNLAADALEKADRKRNKLFDQQEKAKTLRQLQAFDKDDQTANSAVEALVQQVRTDLGLPLASGQQF